MAKTQSVLWAAIPGGDGLATAAPQLMAPLAAANINGGEQALLLTGSVVAGGEDGIGARTLIGLRDNADGVAPLAGGFSTSYLGVVSRLTGFDGTDWDRLRTIPDNADSQPELGLGLIGVLARLQGFNPNGGDFNRVTVGPPEDQLDVDLRNAIDTNSHLMLRSGFDNSIWNPLRANAAANLAATTQEFSAMVASPGEWAVNSEPAVSVQASATRAAGAAGVRHVCRSLHFSLNAVVAQVNIYCRVRDGASGAGTILWSQCVALPAAGLYNVVLSGLNIIGSAATAMTFEWSAAPAATNFQTAGGTGYSTQG